MMQRNGDHYLLDWRTVCKFFGVIAFLILGVVIIKYTFCTKSSAEIMTEAENTEFNKKAEAIILSTETKQKETLRFIQETRAELRRIREKGNQNAE